MSAALLDGTTAAGSVLVLSIVAALGLALGAVRLRGVGLGIAGVLFVGLAFGHFGVRVDERTREFVRVPSAITSKRLIVTRTAATGKTVAALDFARRFGVQITRVSRAEVEMSATPGFELQYGDTVIAVGEAGDLQKVAAELGDSPKSLNYPHLVPMFAGIALGIVVGSLPFSLPGVPSPVRLGLAGGPLLVAIALSRIGTIGSLVWYMLISANYALRETGIVLFLAAVGLAQLLVMYLVR